MRDAFLDLPFPLRGLNTNTSFDAQPPGTSRSMLNCRGYEPTGGMERGGQRSGLTRYCAGQINGSLPIQDINHIATSVGIPVTNPGDMAVPLSSGGSVKFFSSAAAATGTAGAAGDTFNCATWDASSNCYVGICDASNNLLLKKVARDGTVAWTTTLAASVGATPHGVYGVAWDNGSFVYVLGTGAGLSPVLRIWKVAVSNGAISGGTHLTSEASAAAIRDQSNAQPSLNVLAYCSGYLLYPSAANQVTLYKVSSGAKTVIDLGATDFGTAVTDCASDGNSYFYVLGYNTTGPKCGLAKVSTGGATLFKVELSVAAYSLVFNGPVSELGLLNTTNFYLASVLTGTVLGTYALPSGANWAVCRNSALGGFNLYARAATNNFTQIDLGFGTPVPIQTLVGNNVNAGVGVNQQTAPTSWSQADVRLLVTSGGRVQRVKPSGPVPITNGNVWSVGAPRIFTTVLFDRMYGSDGLQMCYYDAGTDAMKLMVPTAGSLPQDANGNYPRNCCTWRQRVCWWGLIGDSANWFFSAVGDGLNYNYNPIPTVETQAVAGNLSTAGVAPDILMTMIPYSDEILLMGQTHSIYQMTGDPMAGGRIDLVTDVVGMAYGRPWCRDGSGNVYFVSSNGSVYLWAPGAIPQRISDAISENFLTLDLSNTIVELAWDERQSGFHAFLSPTAGGPTTNYFYHVPRQAWYADSFASSPMQPFCVHPLSGFTPADRNVLLGGQDGYLRYHDPAAIDDDGTAVQSYVYLGPLKGKDGQPAYVADLQGVLGAASGNVGWSLYSGSSAQQALLSSPAWSGAFRAGRNRSQAVRAFGHAHYVKLSNLNNNPGNGTWQLETLRARLRVPEGRTRQRAF
jgi:hypothetical protein